MTEEMRQIMREEIAKAVKETVNGKITALDQKVSDHIEIITPFIQAYTGAKILGNALKWLASLAVAWLALKSFFH